MFVGLWGEKHRTKLTAVAVLMERASQTLDCVAICPVLSWDYQISTHTALRGIFPVIVMQAVHLPNFPLCKTLLSDWLPAGGAHEAGRVIGSLQRPDHVIFDDLAASPARLQTGLVAVLTQGDPSLVVVDFPSESSVTLSTLEAAAVVRPVQCLDRRLTQSHGLTTEPTHIWCNPLLRVSFCSRLALTRISRRRSLHTHLACGGWWFFVGVRQGASWWWREWWKKRGFQRFRRRRETLLGVFSLSLGSVRCVCSFGVIVVCVAELQRSRASLSGREGVS